MVNLIVSLIILAIIMPVIYYIVRAKKKGQKCIGCPNASGCGGTCHCNNTKFAKK